ncbi:hypothetical protein BH09VER1_BH09VER1_30080 [soil metagenome]
MPFDADGIAALVAGGCEATPGTIPKKSPDPNGVAADILGSLALAFPSRLNQRFPKPSSKGWLAYHALPR